MHPVLNLPENSGRVFQTLGPGQVSFLQDELVSDESTGLCSASSDAEIAYAITTYKTTNQMQRGRFSNCCYNAEHVTLEAMFS